MLQSINGVDLVLAVLAAAGWTAFAIERSAPVHPRRKRPVVTERLPYDWKRDGL